VKPLLWSGFFLPFFSYIEKNLPFEKRFEAAKAVIGAVENITIH